MRRRVLLTGVLGCALALAPIGSASASAANHIKLVSVASPETTNNGSVSRAVSANGRWVVFSSEQPNIVPGDPGDGGSYMYLADLNTGAITRISHGTLAQIIGNVAISGTGRYVVYSAEANGDEVNRLYRYDRTTGTTTVLDEQQPGEEIGGVSYAVDTTTDGRYVFFIRSTGPDSDHINRHLLRWDAATGLTTQVVPEDLSGTIDRVFTVPPPSVSADGRTVAFVESGPVGDDNLSVFSLVLLDTSTNTRQTVVSSGPTYATELSASLSDNGKSLAYTTAPGGTFLWHNGHATLITGDVGTGQAQISNDGQFVAYIKSPASVYLYDAQAGTSAVIPTDRQGAPLTGRRDLSSLPYVDRHGDTVVFTSQSRKLAGATPTHLERVYAWQRP